MARDPSLARQLLHITCDLVAEYITPRAAPGSSEREAAYLTAMSLISTAWARVAGGEWVYVPRTNPVELEQTRARIALALQAGEPPPAIARREGVTERHVRKVRGTIRP